MPTMRLFHGWRQLLAVLLLVVPSCLAGPAFTNTAWDVRENQPFTIQWTGASAAVKIELLSGTAQSLSTKEIIAGKLRKFPY